MADTSSWSKEQIEILSKMWREGYSCTVIGERLGKSRNAVIGKRLRLGMPGRGKNNRPLVTRRSRHSDETYDLIVRLRCAPWNWDARSIAQALGEKPQIVHNVIHLNTEAAA